MENEMWRSIPGFSRYEASSLGKVRSFCRRRTRILKSSTKGGRYLGLFLVNDNGKYRPVWVHRIVWSAFNGKLPVGMHINHLDFNPKNNAIENLQICTPKQNYIYSSRFGFLRSKTKHLTDLDVAVIRKSERNHMMLARLFGISKSMVSKISRGVLLKHMGGIDL